MPVLTKQQLTLEQKDLVRRRIAQIKHGAMALSFKGIPLYRGDMAIPLSTKMGDMQLQDVFDAIFYGEVVTVDTGTRRAQKLVATIWWQSAVSGKVVLLAVDLLRYNVISAQYVMGGGK